VRLECEIYHSPPSNDEVKNLSLCLDGVMLRHRKDLTMLYLFYDVSKNLQAGVLKDANTGNSD